MKVDLTPQHEWLQQLVGEWEQVPDEATPEPDWRERVRSLHGAWVVVEGSGIMPGGGPAESVMAVGYDPARGCFVGTWIDSMMSHHWVYEGHWEDGVLHLEADGPDFENPGQTLRYRDSITFDGPDRRTLTGAMRQEDGTWKAFMHAQYRRVSG